jgi:S1-C subfamily serine protease
MKRYLRLWILMFIVLLSLGCAITIPKSFDILPQFETKSEFEEKLEAPAQITATPVPIVLPENVVDEQSLLVNLYARINPSVVNITVYQLQGGTMMAIGQGSGFLYDGDRHIVTNAHVVQDADQVEVTFSDGLITSADIVGLDLNSDLAVVQVEDVPDNIMGLTLGKMDDLAVGQTVLAIGNPFGLEGTLTKGIISALGRDIPALTPFSIPQSIQTDAAINPGNSGGPLLNLNGEVIGVNAQIETGSTSRSNSGVGFAIPVNIVEKVVPELIEKNKVEWSWVGVSGRSLTPDIVEAMNLPVNKGAYIADITKGGPAEKAGLHGSDKQVKVNRREIEIGGDVIVAIDDQPIESFDDLLVYVAMQTKPKQDIKLTVIRDGKIKELTLTLGIRPDNLDTQLLQ